MQYGDEIWERLFASQEWGRYPPEEVIRFFMRSKAALNKKQLSVLDIGCGQGACSWFMAKEGSFVVAFDGAPTALKKLREVARRFGVEEGLIDAELGDITSPGSKLAQQFDLMLDNYSLCSNHIGRILQAFQEYHRLLADDGLFLTNCFGKNTTGFGKGVKIAENSFKDIPEGVLQNRRIATFFDREELDAMFIDNGYKIRYKERIMEDRTGVIVEKHVTCLAK